MTSLRRWCLVGLMLLGLFAGTAAAFAVCPIPGESCFYSGMECWCVDRDITCTMPPPAPPGINGFNPDCVEKWYCLGIGFCEKSCGECSCCDDMLGCDCDP